jgi:hypothetical protein
MLLGLIIFAAFAISAAIWAVLSRRAPIAVDEGEVIDVVDEGEGDVDDESDAASESTTAILVASESTSGG